MLGGLLPHLLEWLTVRAEEDPRSDAARLVAELPSSFELRALISECRILRRAIRGLLAEQAHASTVATIDEGLDLFIEQAAERHAALQPEQQRQRIERQRLIVQAARLGTWEFEPGTGRIEWSPRCRELLGVGPAIKPDVQRFFECIHPDDRAELRARVEAALAGHDGGAFDMEYRLPAADGRSRLRWVHSLGRTLFDPAGAPLWMIGTLADVTERMMATEWKNRFEAATLASRQLLYDWNAETNEVFWAGHTEAILGYLPEQMPGTLEGFIEMIHPDEQARFRQEIAEMIAIRRPAHLSYLLRRKDGSYISGEDNGRFFFDAQGKPTRMIGFIADVTEKKQIEEQRDSARRRAETLAELDRAKTEFFSNISHEFRTPLTLILGPVEDALGQSGRALGGEDLEAVHRSAVRLLRLVNSLLDVSRIEAARLEIAYQPTDLAVLTADLASSFRSLIERAGLRFVVDCPRLPEQVYVGPSQWEKIVLNLLSNAFKFTLQGEISLSLSWHGDHVELAVRDTGTGIPQSELPHIFNRFYRVEGAEGRSFEGTGIGLSLVQELVKLHGGTVSVSSEKGRGSTFVVSIPTGRAHITEKRIFRGKGSAVSAASTDPYVLEAARWLQPSKENWTNFEGAPEPSSLPSPMVEGRILVVDDNADLREYLVRLLEKRWQVEAAADGQSALTIARERPPDLVVSDVLMPRMDGFALLHQLRADPRTNSVPVVLLSARAGEEALLEGLQTGADDYLIKPFSARELVTRVQTHLQLARARREAAEAHEQERGQKRLRVLAEATAALAESLDYPTTISEVARLAVPQLADWCVVDLDMEDGRGHHMEVAHAGPAAPELTHQVELFCDELCTSPERRAALQEGRPILMETVSEERLKEIAQNEAHFLALKAIGVCSALAVPLLARGHTLGALIFISTSASHLYTTADLDIVQELAHRCAVAIDNSRLHQQAQEAVRARDQFLSIASHELRTPLTPLKLQLQSLEKQISCLGRGEVAPKEMGRRIAVIRRQGERLEKLVGELLDVSRITAKQLPFVLEDINIVQVVREVKARLEETGEVARSKCTVVLHAPARVVGHWDRFRLDQVVTNLLENALKFGAGGSIELSVESDAVEATLTVTDHGIGIAAADRRRIFQRFERAVSERHYGGMGLGLWIVRQVVEGLGGSIELESVPGQGATFRVRLPLAGPPPSYRVPVQEQFASGVSA